MDLQKRMQNAKKRYLQLIHLIESLKRVGSDTSFMETVSFHRKIKSPFSYNNKINVVTFENKKNKVLNSKKIQTINGVSLYNKKRKRKIVIINSLYTVRVFSPLKYC